MKTTIVLYILLVNRKTLDYEVLSEHPDKYIECGTDIVPSLDIDSQVKDLYSKYLDLHPDYVRFINLRPTIEENILKIPFYCIIPYNSYEIKNSYKLPCKEYAQFIPHLRQILNTI